MALKIDKAPTNDGISGLLPQSWTRWFQQCYTAIAGLIANFGTLQTSLTTLSGTVAGIQTSGTLTNPTLSGIVTISTPASLALGSGWLTWTPTLTPSGSMTATGISILDAQYLRIGPLIYFKVQLSFTLGGTASNLLQLSLPATPIGAANSSTPVALDIITSSTFWSAAFGYVSINSGNLNLYLNAGASYPLGATTFMASGSYRAA